MRIIDWNGMVFGTILIIVALVCFLGMFAVITGSSILIIITLYIFASMFTIFLSLIVCYGLILLRQSISKV